MTQQAVIDALKRIFATYRACLPANITDEDLILLAIKATNEAKGYYLLSELLPDLRPGAEKDEEGIMVVAPSSTSAGVVWVKFDDRGNPVEVYPGAMRNLGGSLGRLFKEVILEKK
jgi:hypothetical protein